MYEVLLVIHMLGAVTTGVVILSALFVLLCSFESLYRRVALALAALASCAIVSGTLLAFVSPDVTAVSLCGNVALYLVAVAGVLVIFSIRMRSVHVQFPLLHASSTIGVSVAVFLGGLILGV